MTEKITNAMRIILFVFFLLSAGLSSAQSGRLNEQQLKDFRDQALQKLESIQAYFSKIGNKDTPNNVKDFYIKQATSLFKPGAIIQVSSKNGGLKNYSVPNYLQHLKTYSYRLVIIEYIAEAFYFSEFKEVKDDKGNIRYVATATVVQKFCGIYDAGQMHELEDCDYHDTTEKQVEVILDKIKTYDEKDGHWVVYLGDITVSKTQ